MYNTSIFNKCVPDKSLRALNVESVVPVPNVLYLIWTVLEVSLKAPWGKGPIKTLLAPLLPGDATLLYILLLFKTPYCGWLILVFWTVIFTE